MVADYILPHAVCGLDDHRKDASPFTGNLCAKHTEFYFLGKSSHDDQNALSLAFSENGYSRLAEISIPVTQWFQVVPIIFLLQ